MSPRPSRASGILFEANDASIPSLVLSWQLERHLERGQTRLGHQGHSDAGPNQFHPGLSHANRFTSHSPRSTLRFRDGPDWARQGGQGRTSDGDRRTYCLSSVCPSWPLAPARPPSSPSWPVIPSERGPIVSGQYGRRNRQSSNSIRVILRLKLRSTCRAAPRSLASRR